MKKQVFNPYLPSWEHVPDGEPHIFGDRLYVYGSHDGGHSFCELDYVLWSAPLTDLSDWRYEGVIYRKDQDPINGAAWQGQIPPLDPYYQSLPGPHTLFAPDAAEGPGGRYYLYYSLDFSNLISVAVADKPEGPFEFLSYVTYADGSVPKEGRKFDPAILVEKSGIYLYYGFCPEGTLPGEEEGQVFEGAMAVRLADDMHTVISKPVCVANGCDTAKGTDYQEHPFFEAYSIRHFGDLYYFVYSSLQGHELCYGVSKDPLGHFLYQGVLLSNADIGYKGNKNADCYWGNNHGGLVCLNGDLYIFGHRQTHGNEFNRQGIAEKVPIEENGRLGQARLTSCGLNGGPLKDRGWYPAYIACSLMGPDRDHIGHVMNGGPSAQAPDPPSDWPYITEEGNKSYIKNMQAGSTCAFRSFSFGQDRYQITIEARGRGVLEVHFDQEKSPVASTLTVDSGDWAKCADELTASSGVHALSFTVKEGQVDLAGFELDGLPE